MNTCIVSNANKPLHTLPRWFVFNELPSIRIDGTPGAEACCLADTLWERIQGANHFKPWCQDDKRAYWHLLVHVTIRAIRLNCCIRYRRDRRYTKATLLQVIDCAVDAGILIGYRAKPGFSERSSRLLPSKELCQQILCGPQPSCAPVCRQYVRVRRKADKLPLDFDPAHSIAAETQQKLSVVNDVLAGCRITYRRINDLYAAGVCQFCPIHYRLFHENWQHGRIYLESDGNGTSLRGEERETIYFNDEPSVELDYGAMHPRMAYHRRGLESPDKPYDLWMHTSTAQRELAKRLINTALNAGSRRAAIGACCEALRLITKSGKWKVGNKRKRAYQLRDALRETIGISPKSADFFKEARRFFEHTYDLAAECHAPIACDFLTGLGRVLMRIESSIALDVLYHFASKCVPVLGVHDSFIVPESHSEELLEVMVECYRAKLDFSPLVK